MQSVQEVHLGFAEPEVSWSGTDSSFYHSKIGGKPAWIPGVDPPSDIVCAVCSQSLALLCQLYSPVEELEDCFHRILYVFICRKSACFNKNTRLATLVLRVQLPRDNRFFKTDAICDSEAVDGNIAAFSCRLCAVCGHRASSQCSKCQQIFYCNKDHQILDWNNGHSVCCADGKPGLGLSKFLFPEAELVIEEEEREEKELTPTPVSDVEHRHDFLADGYCGTLADCSEQEMDGWSAAASTSCKDSCFAAFKKRIRSDPDQVIRYQRLGSVLWVYDKGQTTCEGIPVCDNCQCERVFEFQILPQMLNHLQIDSVGESIDWATLVIYTCRNSCSSTDKLYVREHMHIQLPH